MWFYVLPILTIQIVQYQKTYDKNKKRSNSLFPWFLPPQANFNIFSCLLLSNNVCISKKYAYAYEVFLLSFFNVLVGFRMEQG